MDIKFQLGRHHGKQHSTLARLSYVDVELHNGSDENFPGSFRGYMDAESASLVLAAPAYKARVTELETALRRLLQCLDDEASNREGEYVLPPDAGCIECTLGTVPNDKNTGLCAYHSAQKVLKDRACDG